MTEPDQPSTAPDDGLPVEQPEPEPTDPDEVPGEVEYREDGDTGDVPDPEDQVGPVAEKVITEAAEDGTPQQ